MKEKCRFACNRYLIYGLLMGAFLGLISSAMFSESELVIGIGCAIFALIIFVGSLLLMPFGYRFDQKGVTLCYLFVPNERYLWKKIRAIEVDYDHRSLTAFKLEGQPEGKHLFYMDGKIHKTRRTKRLLETYWDGTITGYFFEGLHNWWHKRRKKRENEIRQHLTDEVAPMERAARAETRSALALYDAQADQLGLKLRIKFLYITDEFDELKDRPHENYTYTVLTELCRPGESDENKIITVSADLLHVRLGRTSYRGVRDEDALTELQQELTEVLEEVRKTGMDAYCADMEEMDE